MNLGISALFLSLCALTLSICSVCLNTREKRKKEAVTDRLDKEKFVRLVLNTAEYYSDDEDFLEGVEFVLVYLKLVDVKKALDKALEEENDDA